MTRWQFAFLTVTLSVAAGCPNSAPLPAPPAAPAPAAAPEAPLEREAPGEAPAEDLGRAAEQRDLGAGPPPADPDEPLYHRFEHFSDRGSRGHRSYKWGELEVEILDGHSVRYERDEEGRVVRALFDDGQVHEIDRLPPSGAVVTKFGIPVGEKCTVLKECLGLDESGRPYVYGSKRAAWVFTWKDGLLTEERSPRGDRSYTYDSLQRIASWRDTAEKGVTLEREGAETRHLLADGQRFVLVEDSEGALREARQGEEVYTFTHEDGQLTGTKSPLATLSYTHEGTRRGVESPWGTSLTEYERRLGAERARWTETPAGTFRFDYSEGKRSQLRYPNGVVARYRYREGRDLVRLESSVLDLERKFNEHGLLVHERRDGDQTPSVYGYDGYRRLTEVSEGGAQATYAYAEGGARAARYLTPNELVLDKHNDYLVPLQRIHLRRANEDAKWEPKLLQSYGSDAAGRILEIFYPKDERSDRFSYDGAGRLQVAHRAGGQKVRYTYDPLGRISSRSVGEGAQVQVTRYVYDGPRLLAELGPGDALRVYAHGPDLDEPLAYRDGKGPWIYLHGDERGSVLAYSDDKGRRVDSVTYSAFGVLTKGPQGDRPLFFAGHRYDPETRLVLARARAYDPDLNRFLGPDPAGVRDGVNPFAYAKGNPLSFVDPLGLYAQPSTIRSHYGTLSPRAQLLLLQGVNGLRMAPNPKAPVLSLFKGVFPDLQVGTPKTTGETRSGQATTDFVERLAQVETQEEAEELLASPLAKAAREELGDETYRIAEGVAKVVDDDERSHDSQLLRELLAPTAAENDAGRRMARSGALRMQFREKYLGIEPNRTLLRGMMTTADHGGVIARRTEQAVRATEIPHATEIEQREIEKEVDQVGNMAWVHPGTPAPAKPAEHHAPSKSTFAKKRVKSLRFDSAGAERLAYRNALKAQRKLWKDHAEGLQSLEMLDFTLRNDEVANLDELLDRYRDQNRAAALQVREAEAKFREAMVEPLGDAEAYRRIAKDTSLFDGDKIQQLMRESTPVGEQEALQGRLKGFVRFGHLGGADRPDYAERKAALSEQLAQREARAQRAAQLARRAEERAAQKKARKKARRRSGVTLPGERVASRRTRKRGVTIDRGSARPKKRIKRSGVTAALGR